MSEARGPDTGASLRSLLAASVAGHLRLASRLSALVWEPVLDGLAAAAARPSPAPAAPGPDPIRRDVARGEVVTLAFAVENRYDHPLEVGLAADPLVPAAGPAVPPDVVSFDPAAPALPPGGRVVVRAVVQVTERFAVGETYATALHVRHLPCAPVPVEITVRPGSDR